MDKVHIDEWRNASRSDFNSITESISKLADEMKKLNAKVDAISKPSKTSRTPKTTKKTITSKKK
jgi:hypothetical protein